jgi:NADPH-dependent curcumin reductase CurA
MESINRRWRLARRPIGHDYARAFELRAEAVPHPGRGEVLVRNAYLSLDAGTRMRLTERSDSYDPPAPVGSALQGHMLGTVAESEHPDYRPGQLLRFRGDWADYSLLTPGDGKLLQSVTWTLPDPRQHLAALGPNAWTAYVGVHEVGEAGPADTVVISAASGVTGALAGQIAKLHGCRVVGITGSSDKARWLTETLGFDDAIDRQAEPDMSTALRTACPDGIDVYFENVGGPLLEAALGNMSDYGRIAICGLLVNYDKPVGLAGPANFDQILMKRLKIGGFLSFDWYWRGPEINRTLRPWYDAGQLRMEFDVTEGLENAPDGYRRLFTGDKIGKSLVQISPLDPDNAERVTDAAHAPAVPAVSTT